MTLKLRYAPFLGLLLVIAIVSGLKMAEVSQKTAPGTELKKDGRTPGVGASFDKLSGTTTVAPAGRPLFASPLWGKALTPPLVGRPSKASICINATATLDPAHLTSLRSLRTEQRIAFPLAEVPLEGTVHLVQPDDAGWTRVGGEIHDQKGGHFSLAEHRQSGAWKGQVYLPEQHIGYQFETTAAGLLVHKKPIDAMLCAMPRAPGETRAASAASATGNAAAPPLLSSRPSATGVAYLDFDGEVVTDPGWNSGYTIVAQPALMAGAAISTAQIIDVWQRVAEDFAPFDVNVTTDRSVYDNAPVGHRAMCIITPTDGWYPYYVGGVAKFKGYRGPDAGHSSTVPCWTFNNTNPSVMALTCSHELGHMFDLSHDGTSAPNYLTYYGGHDYGTRSWGPLMGAPWGRLITTWSIGDYPDGNNTEDDVKVISDTITEPGVGSSYVPDEAGHTLATAADLPLAMPVNVKGVVTTSTDVDWYKFNALPGTLDITVTPASNDPNLDVKLALLNSLGASIAQANVGTTLTARLQHIIPTTGTYYLAISGRNRPEDPLASVIGYSNYGSLGAYSITGTFVPLPEVPLFTVQPLPQTANQGTKVTLTGTAISNVKHTYQWKKGNTAMPGKTSNTLTFASIQPADAGDYTLVATNGAGGAPSETVTLVVRYKPVFTQQPAPVKRQATADDPVTYTVVAAGTAPITYVWKKNNTAIPGETGPTLNLGAVDWFDAGSYSVVATNALGSATSAASALAITSPPVITLPPPAVKPLPLGGTGSVTVAAVGTAPLVYQWFKNNAPLTGATKPTYAWSRITGDAAGTYYVRVTNALGHTDSIEVVVTTQDKPVITVNPVAAVNTTADASFTLECTATGGGTLTYQWQLNGVNVPGGDVQNLHVNPVTWTTQGTYRCIVSNTVGSAISKNAVVKVISYPVVLTHPQPVKIATNGTGLLKVVAGGTPALKYQWLKGDSEILGATGATLKLAKASMAGTSGHYKVRVTNLQGSATSNAAQVIVEDPPVIVTQPLAKTAGIGDDVIFTVSAGGSATLQYQWQKNNLNLPGQTSSFLELTGVQTTAAGTYRVQVRNDVGSVFSAGVKLTVLTRPSITSEPAAQSLFVGDPLTLSVKATGSPTLTYQWRKDSNDILGAKSSVYKVSSLALTHAGQYSVVARNAVGTATSQQVMLDVLPIPAPTIAAVRPSLGEVGDRVLVGGTNFRWTTGVTFNGKAAPFIITRNSELLLTVPAGATTGPLLVKTKGGTVASTSDFVVLYRTYGNDDFVNAKIFFGDFGYSRSDNSNATLESYDYPYYAVGKTVWFRWRAPYTGKFELHSRGTSYHNVYWVFTGGPAANINELEYLGRARIHFGYYFDPDSDPYLFVSATKDQDFYIKIDSLHAPQYYYDDPFYYEDLTPYDGTSMVGTSKAFYAAPPAGPRLSTAASQRQSSPADDAPASIAPAAASNSLSMTGAKDFESADSSAVLTRVSLEEAGARESGSVGGSQARDATVAWLPTGQDSLPAGCIVRASAELSIESAEGSEESFAWSLFDREGMPAMAVVFNGTDRSILTQFGTGTATSTGQVFVPSAKYHLELQVNTADQSWRVMLDGVVIAEGREASLPFEPSALATFGASWSPDVNSSSNGIMRFENAKVSNEVLDDSPAQ